PSCADINFSACVLPDNKVGWDNAVIYRPVYDVRACNAVLTKDGGNSPYDMQKTYAWTTPLVPDTSAVKNSSVVFQSNTLEVDSNVWAYCTNAGYDPPYHFTKRYSGPQTGALTDTTICDPKWGGCSSAAGAKVKYFPE